MSIAKSHYNPDKKKRQPKATLTPEGYMLVPENKKGYERTERIIEEIVCDIINGTPKSDCIAKLKEGLYDAQETKKIKDIQNQNAYYNAAVARIQADMQDDREKNLALMIGRMENLYKESMEANDRYGALNALKEIAKIQGLMNQPQTAIQINNADDKVTINFALNGGNS
jgi:pyruvate-formate lyase